MSYNDIPNFDILKEQEGAGRDDHLLKALEDNIELKRSILQETRQLISDQRYSTTQADALLSRFAAIDDMNTPIEQELRQQYEWLFQRNKENSCRFQEQDENAGRKRDLIAQTQSLQDSVQWGVVSRRMGELMDAWKQTGYAGEENDLLWDMFRQARKVFFDRLRQHKKERSALWQARRAQKRQLISDAKDLIRQTGKWKSTHEKLEALLDEWKKIGSTGKDSDEHLWKEFKTVRADFYALWQKAREEQEHEFEQRRTAKHALITEVEDYVKSCNFSQEAAIRMSGLYNEWKQIGFCGKDYDKKLWTQFQHAQNTYWAAKREAGKRKHQEWIAKTQGAINRRRDRISKIQQNIDNLNDRLATTQNSAKLEEIRRWIDGDQEKIRTLEEEIYRMEQELARG